MNKKQKLKQELQELDALKEKVEGLMSCEDKFAELKEAHKNGAVIQFKSHYLPFKWKDVLCNDPRWFYDHEYRVKPESQLDQDIDSIKEKYPQYNITITVEDKV